MYEEAQWITLVVRRLRQAARQSLAASGRGAAGGQGVGGRQVDRESAQFAHLSLDTLKEKHRANLEVRLRHHTSPAESTLG